MSKTETLEDVHKLLAKVESDYLGYNRKFDNVRACVISNDNALIELKTGKLIYLYNGRPTNIDGVHGGLYTTGALAVSDMLRQIRRVTEDEHIAFRRWWADTQKEEDLARELTDLERRADKLGFELVKRGD